MQQACPGNRCYNVLGRRICVHGIIGRQHPLGVLPKARLRQSAGSRGIQFGSRLGFKISAQQQQQQQRAPPPAAHLEPRSIPVTFTLQHEVRYGQSLRVVGDHPSLGGWELRNGATMGWSKGHVWKVEVALPAGTSLEFKCVRVGKRDSDEEWEDGPNHVLSIPASGIASLAVQVDWGGEVAVTSQKASADVPPPPAAPAEVATQGENGAGDATSAAAVPAVGPGVSPVSSADERLPTEGWQGRETVFMQSNEYSRERQGVWKTQGLQGPLLKLVEGDRDNGSWLGKLAVVKELLVDSAPRQRPDFDTLAAVYIYMQWIATGAIPCVEGGGHQRPNRHAELARTCFRSLEWVIEEAGSAAKANGAPLGEGKEGAGSGGEDAAAVNLVARRLSTKLPAFTEAFTRSVPLTRIRDIAHRNDIPSDLKREIKHTLQNKLHRNAGPEDLVATEAMLQRITAEPGQYSESFVSEFKLFTTELRDFFNAGSLADMLAAIRPSMDDSHWQLVERFLSAKSKLDSAGASASQNAIMDSLHGVTSVRALLAASLSSGLRSDAPDSAVAMRQRYRQCEVRAEDYAFVLLSRFINALEDKGGTHALSSGNDGTWALPIGALVLGLRHVGLSGFDPGECMAVERELGTWQKEGGLTVSRDNALRLRGTLNRMQRLTEGYVGVLMGAYAQRAKLLGTALGLDPYLVTIFPEAEIRASVVFQLSKLCAMLLRATGMVAGGLDDWEVIVGGEARGVLIQVDQLQPGCLEGAGNKAAVLLVKEASGDEEVAALGPQLKGVILRQAIPHLSHLGVRSRQERVPFVCCEDEALIDSLVVPLLGCQVRLKAGVEGATVEKDSTPLKETSTVNGAKTRRSPAARPAPAEKVRSAMRLVQLEDATSATCGSKGAACGELLRLAKHCDEILASRSQVIAVGEASSAGAGGDGGNGSGGGGLFKAPEGVCLPFGCMEVALQADGRMREYDGLLQKLESSVGHGAELKECCRLLEALIMGLRIPQQILQQISRSFKPGTTVITRSSANVEDLAGMSGAGLYESIPNVDSSDLRGLQEAICGVWASLHTRRAVLSRRAAGVPQSSASMAVVVQSMLAPELSFVLHTAHPITRDPATLEAELAPGMGETLAAGTRGSGWRLDINKESGKVTTRAFANFSRAFLPVERDSGNGNGASSSAHQQGALAGRVQLQLVDYSQQPMSASEDVRKAVARRLTAVGRFLEHEFGGPQDVEGCFAGGQLYVVQTRPQP